MDQDPLIFLVTVWFGAFEVNARKGDSWAVNGPRTGANRQGRSNLSAFPEARRAILGGSFPADTPNLVHFSNGHLEESTLPRPQHPVFS